MIGNSIKEYRTKKNLSQKELGKQLNRAQSSISLYENNIVRPKERTIQKLIKDNVTDFYPSKLF